LELCEHRATHGPNATLGPYGHYKDWPPNSRTGADDQGVTGAPARKTANTEGDLVDPVTGEALAPLRHKGLPRDPTADPTTEVYDDEYSLRKLM
jgi:hypothetical protein